MRYRAIVGIGLLCASAGLWSSPARAFGLTGVGAKAGYVSPEDLEGTVALSGHLEFEQSNSRVHVLPSLGYWSTSGVHDLNPNLDLYYHFAPEGSLAPYVGGGLGMHFVGGDRVAGSESDPGVNLFGGLRVPAADKHFFLEGRYELTDITQLSLLGGVTFHGIGH